MADGGASVEPGFRGVAFRVLGVCRARWPALLIAGLIVFVPLSLFDVVTEDAIELEDPDAGTLVAGLAAVAVAAVAAMLGEVIYAGMVAGVVVAERDGRPHSVADSLRHLPYGRLLAVDLLAAGAIALGFLALIVPGFLFMVWFALVAPAVEIEGLGVRDSFRRSRELVRGRFWLVLGLLLPILIAQDALSGALQSASLTELGEGFVGDWVGALIANLVTAPFYAVAVTVLFFELRTCLRAAGGRSSPGTPPRSSRRSRRAATP
jgi:hypothetical protein